MYPPLVEAFLNDMIQSYISAANHDATNRNTAFHTMVESTLHRHPAYAFLTSRGLLNLRVNTLGFMANVSAVIKRRQVSHLPAAKPELPIFQERATGVTVATSVRSR